MTWLDDCGGTAGASRTVRLLGVLILLGVPAARATARPAAGARWVRFQEDTPAPHPTGAQRRSGFILFQRSILERIYAHSRPRRNETAAAIALQAARGEYEPAQVAVYPLRRLHRFEIRVSDLADGAGHVIPAAAVTVRMVRYYGARLSLRSATAFGVVPKTLEIAVPLDLETGSVRPYWITVHVPPQQAGGRYRGRLTFAHASGRQTVPLAVEVIPLALAEPDILYGTLCVGALAGAGDPATADASLRRADIMFRDQREHGMNAISLRAAPQYQERDGQPYLPDLEVALQLSARYGFAQPLIYCGGPLFKTEKLKYADNYTRYGPAVALPRAAAVARHYTKKFRAAGLPAPVFIPVDEPNRGDGVAPSDPADVRQRIARELAQAIKDAGGATALTCTPASVGGVAPFLDYWIVAFSAFTPDLYERAAAAHARLAVYANAAMMGQGTYFPRFLFGYFAWAKGLKGVVPWTYPLQPKRFPRNVGGAGEGALHVTDGFLGLDGKPVPTIQWELSREGIDDAKYMVTIATLARAARAGGGAAAQRAADTAERFLAGVRRTVGTDLRHYRFESPRTFAPQPVDGWNAAKFAALRRESVRVIEQLLAVAPARGQRAP